MSQPAPVPIDTKDTTDIAVLAINSDNPNNDIRVERAKQDAAVQRSMPVKEGMRKYRDALMWSALMTLTVVMESYDYGLMGSLFGFPAFAERFGTRLPNGNYNVEWVPLTLSSGDMLMRSAAMQSILKQITKAGQLVGLFFTGTMVDKLGYKWTMLLSLAALAPVILMQFLAPNIQVMIAAQFLIGVPLAPFLTLSNVSHNYDNTDNRCTRLKWPRYVSSHILHQPPPSRGPSGVSSPPASSAV
jgi:SP family general alpha glucoside:H+ symporter-like MFS transporter